MRPVENCIGLRMTYRRAFCQGQAAYAKLGQPCLAWRRSSQRVKHAVLARLLPGTSKVRFSVQINGLQWLVRHSEGRQRAESQRAKDF